MGEEAVDVVIVSHDRPLPLAALLGDLGDQSEPPGSVTVVDDSERRTDWGARFPGLPLSTIQPRTRSFITAAKNAGAREGRGALVAFIDDDNRIPRELLASLARDLREHPTWGAVLPGVVYHRKPELVWVYATPFRADRWEFELLGRNRPRDPAWEHRILPTDALPNLCVVRREALEAVGGFDEQFPVNSSADLCQRLKSAGWQVVADTGILTRHDVEPPGVTGYWAEHTVRDPERARREVADWFRFHRRWGPGGRGFALRASYHALGFLLPELVAVGIRPARHRLRLLVALGRGYREGLVGPLSEPPAPRKSGPGRPDDRPTPPAARAR